MGEGHDTRNAHDTYKAGPVEKPAGRRSHDAKIPGYLIILAAAVISAVVALDQLSKFLVRSNMTLGEALPSQDAFFSLRYALNDGIAFSLFQGYRVGLITIQSILVVGIIIVMIYVLRRFPSRLAVVIFSLMLGGGIGNLIDRIASGKVTDFFSVGTFPIFNVADTCLTIGCGLMLVCLIFFEKGIFENREHVEIDKMS